jgi:hypothetical protein
MNTDINSLQSLRRPFDLAVMHTSAHKMHTSNTSSAQHGEQGGIMAGG